MNLGGAQFSPCQVVWIGIFYKGTHQQKCEGLSKLSMWLSQGREFQEAGMASTNVLTGPACSDRTVRVIVRTSLWLKGRLSKELSEMRLKREA